MTIKHEIKTIYGMLEITNGSVLYTPTISSIEFIQVESVGSSLTGTMICQVKYTGKDTPSLEYIRYDSPRAQRMTNTKNPGEPLYIFSDTGELIEKRKPKKKFINSWDNIDFNNFDFRVTVSERTHEEDPCRRLSVGYSSGIIPVQQGKIRATSRLYGNIKVTIKDGKIVSAEIEPS